MRKISFLFLLLLLSTQLMAQKPAWAVKETAFENTQTIIAKLSLDGKVLESPNDMVGAFVGDECRGVASPVFIPSAGKYFTYLTVFSNKQGEEIVFKLYESATGRIVPVEKKLSFNINGQLGSFFQTYSISTPTLSNLAAVSSFDLYNVRPDSVVTKGDVRTYYIPANVAKDTLTTNFSVSAGAKVYVKEVPVVPKVTKVNFTNQVIFQVVSQDESTLLEYKVAVISAVVSSTCAGVTVTKPTVALDASYNLVSNATSGNQWYKNGTLISGAVSPTYKPSSNGTYSVKVTTPAGCSSDMSANFNYLITAISSLAKEEFVTLSPNPFTDELRVNYYLVNSTTASISVLDLSGRMVIENKEIGPESSLHLRDLPAGIYVIRLLDSDGRLLYTQKIVKI